MFFRGRWVLITGASSGLGEAIARELAHRHGANLVIVARRAERLQALKEELEGAAGISVHTIAADLADIEQVDRVFTEATTGRSLYAAVLNAGITHFGNWDELGWDGFLRMQAVNNTSVVRMTTQLLPYLEKEGQEGGVLLVASMAGLTPLAYQAMYSATKAFLVNFGASLHHEMWPRKVSVSTFVPGGIDTEMTSGKRFDSLRTWLMPVQECAREAIDALQNRRYIHAPGLLYRWGGRLTRLLPQRFYTAQVAAQYRRSLQSNR
jgi:short-subunit dehydrogenase